VTRTTDPAGRVTSIGGTPSEDIRDEAARLAGGIAEVGLELRLMGGMAVYLASPSVRRPPYARDYGDLDFAVSSRDKKAATGFLEAAGYVGEKMFNALHGAQRLNFGHPQGRWPIDVVVDEIRMSHRLDLRGRLGGSGLTLDLADLLLTKLQIWEINPKDLGDIVGLLVDHDIAASDDPDVIDSRRLAAVTGADWGFAHTVERNLARAAEHGRALPVEGARHDLGSQVESLVQVIAAAPKSMSWKARARVGERVRWYETPEEVRH
jgi:hypothetical protein